MKTICLISLIIAFVAPASAAPRKVAAAGSAISDQTAAHWMLQYSAPNSAYSYSINLEAEDLETTEEQIRNLARKYSLGEPSTQPYYSSVASRRVMLIFKTTPKKADAFSQQVIRIGKLKQYSSHKGINESSLGEIQRKAEVIGTELENNKDLLRKVPVARALLRALDDRYKDYLTGYKKALNMATLTVTLTRPK